MAYSVGGIHNKVLFHRRHSGHDAHGCLIARCWYHTKPLLCSCLTKRIALMILAPWLSVSTFKTQLDWQSEVGSSK